MIIALVLLLMDWLWRLMLIALCKRTAANHHRRTCRRRDSTRAGPANLLTASSRRPPTRPWPSPAHAHSVNNAKTDSLWVSFSLLTRSLLILPPTNIISILSCTHIKAKMTLFNIFIIWFSLIYFLSYYCILLHYLLLSLIFLYYLLLSIILLCYLLLLLCLGAG